MGLLNEAGRVLGKSTREIIEGHREKKMTPGGGPSPDELKVLQDSLVAPGSTQPPPGMTEGPPATTDAPVGEDAAVDPPAGGPAEPPAPEPTMPDAAPVGEADRVRTEFPNEPVVDPIKDKRTPERRLNVQRHHPGAIAAMPPAEAMENLQGAEDMARYLNVVGRGTAPVEGMSFDTVAAQTDTMQQVSDILGPVFSGKFNGNLTAVQIHAARRLLATLSDDMAALGKKIDVDGDETVETMAEYTKSINAFIALQRFIEGQGTATAQALAQMRMVAQTTRGGGMADMLQVLGAAGTTKEAIAAHARALTQNMANAGNKSKTHVAAASVKRRTITGAFVDYFKNNILSGGKTQMVNVMGNAAVNAYENLIVYSGAAVVGNVRRLIPKDMVPKGLQSPDDSHVRFREQLPVLLSTARGLVDGMAAMFIFFKNNSSMFDAPKSQHEPGRIASAVAMIPGVSEGAADKVETAVTGSFRMLGAMDELYKTTAFRQHVTRLAADRAYGEGLSGTAAAKRANDIIENPPDDIYDEAMSFARDVTLTEKDLGGAIGALAKHTREFAAAHPAFGFLVPFTQTPANLFAKGVDGSIFAAASPRLHAQFMKGGRHRDVAITKVALGTSQLLWLVHLHEIGVITGSGPEDHNERRLLEESTGWKPYAIRVGDTYYSLRRLDPFAMSMAPVLAHLDRSKYAADRESHAAIMKGAMFKIADHSLDKSWLQGLAALHTAANGNERAQDTLLGNIGVSLFVPYASAVNDIRKLTDPKARRVSRDAASQDWKGLYYYTRQQLRNRIPGYSGQIRPKRMWDAELAPDIAATPAWMFSPIEKSPAKEWDMASKQLYVNGVIPVEPPVHLTIRGVSVSMLEFDKGAGLIYDKYIQRVGAARRRQVETLIADPSYWEGAEGRGGERANMLRKAMNRAKAEGLMIFKRDDLGRLAAALKKEDPESYSELATIFGSEMLLEDFIQSAQEFKQIPARFKGKVKASRIPGDARPVPTITERPLGF